LRRRHLGGVGVDILDAEAASLSTLMGTPTA